MQQVDDDVREKTRVIVRIGKQYVSVDISYFAV